MPVLCPRTVELVQAFMILNGSAHVLLNLKKFQQTIPKNDPGTQKKMGMLNVIKQLQHFILCNIIVLLNGYFHIKPVSCPRQSYWIEVNCIDPRR
jgi:hypothetical protein